MPISSAATATPLQSVHTVHTVDATDETRHGPHTICWRSTKRMAAVRSAAATWIAAALATVPLAKVATAADPLYSGPQVGETLAHFEAQQAFGATKQVDVLKDAPGSPTLLLFVHRVTRPSIGFTRLLMNFAKTKQPAGLRSRLIFLSDDPTATRALLRRAQRALPEGVTPLISTDGLEGPGAYGLNRKMTLTILVAAQDRVIANFALLQPSVQADATKVGHAIVQAIGGNTPPTLQEMGWKDRRMAGRQRGQTPKRDGTYRRMMSPVIQKTATPAEVAAAVKQVEAYAARHPWFKDRVHAAASKIVTSGKLANYGTELAQEAIQKWAREFDSLEDNTEASTGANQRAPQADSPAVAAPAAGSATERVESP